MHKEPKYNTEMNERFFGQTNNRQFQDNNPTFPSGEHSRKPPAIFTHVALAFSEMSTLFFVPSPGERSHHARAKVKRQMRLFSGAVNRLQIHKTAH